MPLSNKQTEYLAIAWECFDNEPKIDYEKFARLARLASAHSARELLRVTKKKLREEYGNGGPAAATASPNGKITPTKVTKRTSPTKKKTSTPAGKGNNGKHGRSATLSAAVTAASDTNDDNLLEDDDDEEEEEMAGEEKESPVKRQKGKNNNNEKIKTEPVGFDDLENGEMGGGVDVTDFLF